MLAVAIAGDVEVQRGPGTEADGDEAGCEEGPGAAGVGLGLPGGCCVGAKGEGHRCCCCCCLARFWRMSLVGRFMMDACGWAWSSGGKGDMTYCLLQGRTGSLRI